MVSSSGTPLDDSQKGSFGAGPIADLGNSLDRRQGASLNFLFSYKRAGIFASIGVYRLLNMHVLL